MRALLAAAAAATGLAGLWLLGVVLVVLPSRGPASIPTWTAVALCGLLLAGVSLGIAVVGGNRSMGRRSRLALVAVAAVAGLVGLSLLGAFLATADAEETVLVVGLVFLALGLTAAAVAGRPVS